VDIPLHVAQRHMGGESRWERDEGVRTAPRWGEESAGTSQGPTAREEGEGTNTWQGGGKSKSRQVDGCDRELATPSRPEGTQID
jgi:hypothetical protein